MLFSALLLAGISGGLIRCVDAHGDHGHHQQKPMLPADANWATRHMAEEHHIEFFDAGSFFNLHDFDGTNEWTVEDIKKTFGLKDASTKDIPQSEKDAFVLRVIHLYDRDHSGTVSFAEFTVGVAQGIELPSPPGNGPGHHGDDEYEYEIHHFELYHNGEDTKEEDLTHPEDIEHFRMHERMEEEAERQEMMDRTPIVEANIPVKFRRHT